MYNYFKIYIYIYMEIKKTQTQLSPPVQHLTLRDLGIELVGSENGFCTSPTQFVTDRHPTQKQYVNKSYWEKHY